MKKAKKLDRRNSHSAVIQKEGSMRTYTLQASENYTLDLGCRERKPLYGARHDIWFIVTCRQHSMVSIVSVLNGIKLTISSLNRGLVCATPYWHLLYSAAIQWT